MKQRIQIDKLEPQAYQAMFGLEKYLSECDLSKTHLELIKIRASQINGCAFCINRHTKERIFLLDAWKETDLFSEEEKTLLEMTEEITFIHQKGLTTNTYKKAKAIFTENYMAQIIFAISTINTRNRIAVSTHKPISNK